MHIQPQRSWHVCSHRDNAGPFTLCCSRINPMLSYLVRDLNVHAVVSSSRHHTEHKGYWTGCRVINGSVTFCATKYNTCMRNETETHLLRCVSWIDWNKLRCVLHTACELACAFMLRNVNSRCFLGNAIFVCLCLFWFACSLVFLSILFRSILHINKIAAHTPFCTHP